MYPQLKYPLPELRIKENGDSLEVFDICRKTYVWLSPEEWVRQHVLHYLITHLNYPSGLIITEHTFKVQKKDLRADIVVFNNKQETIMVVECKAPEIKLNNTHIAQALHYNMLLNAPLIVVTNGLQQAVIEIKDGKQNILKEIPKL